MVNVTVTNTHSNIGGVIYVEDLSSIYLTDSNIVNSSAFRSGGVLYINQPQVPTGSS